MSSKPSSKPQQQLRQQQQQPAQKAQTHPTHTKLPKLPKNATITKRPLLHPSIPSSHQSSRVQKTVYLSTRTPFMAAIKRIEKHLTRVSARETQAAEASVRAETRSRKRKFGAYDGGSGGGSGSGNGGDAEAGRMLEVARRIVERREGKGRSKSKDDGAGDCEGGDGWGREEVVVKATGKAISKALEVGGWFVKRKGEGYGVLIKTGTVRAIDDIEVGAEEGEEVKGDKSTEEDSAREKDKGNADAMDTEGDQSMKDVSVVEEEGQDVEEKAEEEEEVPETRIRMLSTIEIAVYKT